MPNFEQAPSGPNKGLAQETSDFINQDIDIGDPEKFVRDMTSGLRETVKDPKKFDEALERAIWKSKTPTEKAVTIWGNIKK